MHDIRARALVAFPNRLQGNLDTDECCRRTLTFACALVNADVGVLARCPAGREWLAATYGCAPETWHTSRFDFLRALVQQTCAQPASLLTSDAQPGHEHDIALSIGLHSILCVPMMWGSQPFGILCVQRRLTAAPFSPDDLELLESLVRLAMGVLAD